MPGTIRPATLVELAKKNGISLPTYDPWHVYEFPIIHFLEMYELCCGVLVDPGDFARVAYESLEDGSKLGNLKYREMFVSPTYHFKNGVAYKTMLDGLVEGIRAAESDFGVKCRLVPSIKRNEGPEAGLEMVREALGDRREEVIGIGMDSGEALGPPELFVEAYAEARKGGLHRTAHVCEDGPPRNMITCLEDLACERLDHGYLVLQDPNVVNRAREEGVYFNVKVRTLHSGYRNHPVKEMIRQGLSVTLNTDDPAIQPSNLALEYIDTATLFEYDAIKMRELCVNAIEASWLDDDERRTMRRDFNREIDRLEEDLTGGSPPEFVPWYRSQWRQDTDQAPSWL